jgi:hypothetical protein
MRAHTITTKPLVGGRGRMRRILPRGTLPARGILPLSLAVALVAATASTASAHRGVPMSLGPAASVGFGDRQVGTASPVQAFALRVRCRPSRFGSGAGPPSVAARLAVAPSG